MRSFSLRTLFGGRSLCSRLSGSVQLLQDLPPKMGLRRCHTSYNDVPQADMGGRKINSQPASCRRGSRRLARSDCPLRRRSCRKSYHLHLGCGRAHCFHTSGRVYRGAWPEQQEFLLLPQFHFRYHQQTQGSEYGELPDLISAKFCAQVTISHHNVIAQMTQVAAMTRKDIPQVVLLVLPSFWSAKFEMAHVLPDLGERSAGDDGV